jgi:hypothetical protein
MYSSFCSQLDSMSTFSHLPAKRHPFDLPTPSPLSTGSWKDRTAVIELSDRQHKTERFLRLRRSNMMHANLSSTSLQAYALESLKKLSDGQILSRKEGRGWTRMADATVLQFLVCLTPFAQWFLLE